MTQRPIPRASRTLYYRWRSAASAGAVGLASLLAASGCAVKNTDILHFLREHEHEVSAIEYRIGIPDAYLALD